MASVKVFCVSEIWYFQIIPPNDSDSNMGISVGYQTKEECIRGISDFKDLVAENVIDSSKSPFVLINGEETEYYFHYFDEKGKEIYSSHRYWHKPNACDGVEAIFRYISNEQLEKIIFEE